MHSALRKTQQGPGTEKAKMNNSNLKSCRTRPLQWFVLGLLAMAQIVLAVPPPTGIAPVSPPPGGFGIDGELFANTPAANVGDWVADANVATGSGLGVLKSDGSPIDGIRTFHFTDPYNDTSNDRIFSGGAKWVDNPNTWGWTSGKPSSKTDINNVLMHLTTDTNGHVWAILAVDRFSTSGDSYIDFEFLQNLLTKNANGTFTSAGPNGGRTTNDILLSVAFTGGGKVADFFAWRWMPSGSGFAYTDITAMLPAGGVFVALNSNTIAAPYGAFGSTTYLPNAFAEAAIDLTAFLGNFDQCESFGFKTIMVKTKASASSSAGIEDFIDPIQYNLNIGPAANAGPDQTRCSGGAATDFPLNGSASSGILPVASTTWSVVSGSVTVDSPNSLATTAHVSSPTAILRLTAAQVNGCSKTDDIVLTAQQPPACAITGPTTLCPRRTNDFTAPLGMNEYLWSISGNGTITGPANAQSVRVVSGTTCGQPFTLTLAVRSNVCAVACESVVLVTDMAGPTLVVPPDLNLDCQASTATNATGVATATDTCSRVTVTYSDAVTNGCGVTKTITRTWLATDECGNATSGVQTIQVVDNTPPLIVCPSDKTVECSGDTSPAGTGWATATDICGSAQVTYTDTVTPACGGTQTIARKWTAVDLCGNTSTCTQTITVRDTTAPSLIIPANVTKEYPADTSTNATGIATGSDACGNVTISFTDSTTNNCGNTKTIARRWMAVDECGNSTSLTQLITVRDTTAPVITCPSSVTLEYPAITTTNATGVPTATDAGGSPIITYADTVTNTCGNTRTITRRWTATDACGNSDSCTQMIVVRDTTPPALTLPPNLTIECSQSTATNATGVATATDANGTPTITYTDSVTNACGATMTIARRWTATDACGNLSSGTQIITVRDTIPPVITCPPSLTLEAPAITTTNVMGVATATDSCSAPTVSFTDSVTTNCGSTKVITRTWRATDPCGNSSTCVQTISVVDTTKPVLTIPTNVTVECGSSTAPAATGFATATDTASTPVITYTDSFSVLCGNTKLITRIWTATDACGNKTNATQLITVMDSTPPTLIVPANVAQQAPGDTRTNVTGTATAADGCGSVVVAYSDTVSNSCGLSKTVWRLWTAVDQCGNATNKLQTITVVDTQKPVISIPNVTVQCVGDVPAAHTTLGAFRAAGGTATDNSGNTNLGFSLMSDSGLVGLCPGVVTRVYRVTDDCGNFAETSQKITVSDTIPPVVTCPPSLTVTCGNSLDPATMGYATAMDNCSTNLTINYTDAAVDSSYTLNWYASDPAPNSAPYLPTFQKFGPADIAIPTGGRAVDPLRNAVAYGPTASQLDALTSLGGEPFCLGQIVPFQAVIEASGGRGPENGRIEFTAAWATHTTSNDEFGYDKNYKVLCAFVDSADVGMTDPHFNAKVDSVTSYITNAGTIDEKIIGNVRVSGIDPGDRIVVEIWVVLMNSQPDHVGGTIAADIILANKLTSPVTAISTGVKTISIGNLNKLTQLPPPQSQPPLPPQPQPPAFLPGIVTSIIDRTWRATDNCGNTGSCTQRFTVLDAAAPALTVPANVELEAPAATGTNVCGVATAVDTCGTAAISYSDTVSNFCGNTKVISRVWRAADQWGNSTNATQTITVVDTTAPSLIVPTNVVLECPSQTDTNICGMATAQDLGGLVTIKYSDSVSNCCGISQVITRLWTATDPCGNAASAVQTISVVDTTAPTLSTVANKSIAYNQPIVFDAPTATDASGVAIVSVLGVSTNRFADGSYAVTCTWCATDACGNKCQRTSQTITVAAAPVVVPTLQQLTISAANPNGILLRWPTNAASYRLESAPTMDAKRWTPVAVTPTSTNGEFQLALPMDAPSRFFRLSDGPPFLELSASASLLHLSWPTAPTGFQLESSDTGLPGSWTAVLVTPVASNAFNHVSVPISAGTKTKLFRLKK